MTERIGKRIKVSRRDDGVEAELASPKTLHSMLAVLAWLGWIAFFWVFLIASYPESEGGSPPVFLWIMWIVGSVFAVVGTLWIALGKETTSIDRNTLRIKKSVLGYGPTRSFSVDEVADVRAAGTFRTSFSGLFFGTHWWSELGLTGGSISFDYRGKTRRMAPDLDESDAKKLAEVLKAYFG